MIEYIELEYTSLPVKFNYGPRDWKTGYGIEEFNEDVSYTYKVDKDSVKEVILDLIPEDEYNKIIEKNLTPFESADEIDIAYRYIETNFDELFKRFEDEILEYFEQAASEEAARTIDPEDYIYEDVNMKSNKVIKKLHEDFDPFTDIVWDPDLIDKFEFLQEHETYDGQFSRDVKIWDLDLTAKQQEYYGNFLENGGLDVFWSKNKQLARDIFQTGRQGGHLVLSGDEDSRTQPTYYNADLFTGDLTECFAEWVLDNQGIYLDYYETEDELNEVKEEFISWLDEAYAAVEDFDERTEKLVELFKQDLDKFIEREEAPSDDLTETMFSEVEDIEEPELDKLNEYDEINESYFDSSATRYLVIDVSGNYLNDFEDVDEAIEWAEYNWKAFEVQEITDTSAITVWRRNGFPDGDDEDDFDECYDDASDELPEMEEDLDYNPDFDDDFAGHHYTSYDLYKAQQEFSDEEAFEDRDPDRYDDKHAKEWMKKHPHGWYNSESDYGIGDEDLDEALLEKISLDYNKYKLPHDVVDFIVKTAEQDIDERLYFNDHDWLSMDSSETSDWVMDRIEIQFPGWKWTDENMSYVEAIVDDVMDYFLKKDTSIDESLITEATMSDLDIEIQETGYDELIDKIQRNIDDLEREERFLTRQAPREIGKGGNFDSQEEIDSALAATQRELERERAKLAIVRGQQNG